MSSAGAAVLVAGDSQRAVDAVRAALALGALPLGGPRALLSHFLRLEARAADAGCLHVWALRVEEYRRCPAGFSKALLPAARSASDFVLALGGAAARGPGAPGGAEGEGAGDKELVEALCSLAEASKTVDSRLTVVLVPPGVAEGPAGEEGEVDPGGDKTPVSPASQAPPGLAGPAPSVSSEFLTDLVARLGPSSVMSYDSSPDFASRLRHLLGL